MTQVVRIFWFGSLSSSGHRSGHGQHFGPVEQIMDEISQASKRQRQYPPDWPLGKALDLRTEDLPHESSGLEWWYVNAHLGPENAPPSLATGGLVFCLFRLRMKGNYHHAVLFSVRDNSGHSTEHTLYEQHSDPQYFKEAMLACLSDFLPDNSNLSMAFKAQLDRLGSSLPLPDHTGPMESFTCNSATGCLSVDFGPFRFGRQEDGQYLLVCRLPEFSCDLRLRPEKKPFLHNGNGVVSLGVAGTSMFYYSIPRNSITGSLGWFDSPSQPIFGTAWYDHEFGAAGPLTAIHEPSPYRTQWLWGSAVWDNGWEATASEVIVWDKATNTVAKTESWVDLIDRNGDAHTTPDVQFTNFSTWISLKTSQRYRVGFEVQFPAPAQLVKDCLGSEQAVDLTLRWDGLPDREIVTIAAQLAFYEGHAGFTAALPGLQLLGRGFVEDAFSNRSASFDELLRNISAVTFEEVARFFPQHPLPPTFERLLRRPGEAEAGGQAVPECQASLLKQALSAPFHEIFQRGGKSWRAFAMVLTGSCLNANPEPYRSLIFMPELLHTGSLIVDDVEDQSLTRRGGPCAHHIFGEALAINAGSAAYFYPFVLLDEMTSLSVPTRLQLYQILVHALRSAHLGQGLDILTIDKLVVQGLTTGDFRPAQQCLLALYQLKSGVPVSAASRMACLVVDAAPGVTAALGRFWEAVGTSFQIVDDILNLRGFERNLKDRGEDIRAGKFTLPVLFALQQLGSKEEAQELYKRMKCPDKPEAEVQALIECISQLGCLDRCSEFADGLLETAWQELEVLLPETYAKSMLQAFLYYLIQRHY